MERNITYLALYRGEEVAGSKLLALTADPVLVAEFAERLLRETFEVDTDPVAGALGSGRKRALELVRDDKQACR